MDNIQLVIAKLLDKNNDGYVTPEEIACFFQDIWEDENVRMKINEVSRVIMVNETDKRCYLLIQQFCVELGLDYYFDIIKGKGVTTKMFLNSTFDALKCAFKEIDPEHISLLHLKAKAHNDRKEFFFNIMKRAMEVELEGRKVAHDVENAMIAGRLTLRVY
jgi:hypothetical protein